MQITPELIESHGLSSEEYRRITGHLGREPNLTELGIFSVMWSEHCSYKSSRPHLSKLPTTGPQVVEGPGENAGVVDLGNGLAAVFKIESHNHPSFIEPYQGAATGVGGIVRDIFTMGARPLALMDSLHFGSLDDPANQLIMEGVVAGIAGYGNCIGVPTVGGEVHFDERYSHNPIVNVFCLGIAPLDGVFRARASGEGNPVIYAGARTGRDGIHGATMASEAFSEDSDAKRPTVQVGDPFLEKLLLEACLETMASGALVGIQDMGAAGLTCSTCEMGSRGGSGIEIHLDRVPQRETGMSPYQIMLSESQERMLLVARKGREEEVLEIFRKWDLDAVVIGSVAGHARLVVHDNGERVADLPTAALTDESPLYDRPTRRPDYLDELPLWPAQEFGEPADYRQLILEMAASAPLCSRRWVYQQYDHMVRTNTAVHPGGDAAVLRVKGREGGLAMSLDGNSRYCELDPRRGAGLALAESCRNLVVSGAAPLAATNCLNFGNPENPEIMWQFVEAVEGLAEACRVFGTPITGGNVSFYNETRGRAILPSPVVGVVGRLESMDQAATADFKSPGDLVYLLGEPEIELGGSVYLQHLGLPLAGPCPRIDLSREKQLQDRVLDLVRRRLVASAHDVSEGGLAFALLESCLTGGRGAAIDVKTSARPDHFLFSEAPGSVVVSVSPGRQEAFLKAAADLSLTQLGEVTPGEFRLSANGRLLLSGEIPDIFEIWDSALDQVFRH